MFSLVTKDKKAKEDKEELERLVRLVKSGKRFKDKKRLSEHKRKLREKEKEKNKKKRDETLPIDKTSIPSRNPREIIAAYNRIKNENDKQVYDIPGAVNTINKYIDQKGFTINIDYNNLRGYNHQMYNRYYRRLYPGHSNIHVYMRDIPLNWIPITGNELLRQILIHYMLLSREEFKSWQVRQNWERYNLPSPLTSARLERIEIRPEDEREMPQIEFQPQSVTTNIYIKSIHPIDYIPLPSKRFEQVLLDKGNDLIPNFNTLIVDDDGYDLRDYDSTDTRNTEWFSTYFQSARDKYEKRRKRGEEKDEIIEKLSLAFFKDLTHWIIFILCKINDRKVEPVPIQNYIISGCLPQHIVKYRDDAEYKNIKSTWCYHIKSNINLFYRAFIPGKNILKERPTTFRDVKKAKEKIAKKNTTPEKWKKRRRGAKSLMDDDINLKF